MSEGTIHSSVIDFNTVMGKLYREAVRLILRAVEGPPAAVPAGRPAAFRWIEAGPIVFRNAVPEILTQGRRPMAAVQWPTIFGWYGRELAPAAALMTTRTGLVLIAEKRLGIRTPRQARYGYSATFFPLSRMSRSGFHRKEQFAVLELG